MQVIPRQYAGALAISLGLAVLAAGQAADRPRSSDGKLSPDGSLVLFARYEGGDVEIYTSRPDGTERRKLTDNDKLDGFADWSPDGSQIVFISNRSGTQQVYVMAADGSNVRKLTSEPRGVGTQVRYGPDGRIAYLALRAREGKLRLYDLLLTDGNVSTTVARRMFITEFAWHPDGTSLVYGGLGQLVFHDLASDAQTVVRFPEIDRRLRSHGAREIRWRPDRDSISCRIQFLGGRMEGPDGVPKMFGDDEQFVVTRAGKASWSVAND